MSFDLDFQNLLLSDHVQSIAFTFLDIVVNPSGYRAVARACTNYKYGGERIKFERNANSLYHNGSQMAYVSAENLIVYFKETELATVEGRAHAVHEATHALCDRKGNPVSALNAEGAAYVAQLWYLMNANVAAPNGPVTDAVNAVRGKKGLRFGAPAVPYAIAKDVLAYMQVIGYKNITYAYDGIRV